MSAVMLNQSPDRLPEAKHIYNHDILNCTADGVVGNHLYSGRALGITEPWDIIQLNETLMPLWDDITTHYQRIGLSHTQDVVWYLNLKELGAHIGYQPSVFFYGPEENQYWGDYDWLNTVEYINSKNNFMSLANKLDVDVPKTVCFSSKSNINIDELKSINYPCYLKAAVSVSGVGIYRCENITDLFENLRNFNGKTPLQLQEEVKTDTFLNLQYKVVGKEAIRLAASEQILDGFAHQGNRVPASHEPWDVVEPMAEWLVAHGMKGIFAFDVAISQTKSGLRFPAIECNPRFNGATYPTLMAQKLNIPEWSAINFTTKYRNLADIDLSDIEYNNKTGEGAVIVNWGTVLEGKLVILMAGSKPYQEALSVELAARL